MSKHLYDEQTLTEYLLGSLPEAETERLDELSLTDDEVAEALQVAEQDLVDAYVQEELTEAARAQFKSHYLASPLRREKVAFAQAFQAHAEKSLAAQQAKEARTEAAAEVVPGRKGRSWLSAWGGFNTSRPVWRWGAAVAALALLVAGSWLTFERVRVRQPMAQTQPQRAAPDQREQGSSNESESPPTAPAQDAEERARAERERLAQEQAQREQQRTADDQLAAEQRAASQRRSPSGASSIASFVLAPQMRGANQTQTISVPSQTAHVAVRLNLDPNEFSTYRVALLDETGGQTLWRSSQLRAHASGAGQALNLSFRARLLKPQTRYVLRVTGGAAKIVDDYPFRVVK